MVGGLTAVLGATAFVSCTDKNDWDVDSSYDRLFHTTSLSVAVYEDRVGVTFKEMPNTTGYIVECSTDSLADSIAQGTSANAIIDTLTSSPDTIRGLEASTKYYLRLRGINDEGKTSKWTYLEDYSFTTKAEQIISNVAPASYSAVATFTKGAAITNAWVLHTSDGVTDSVAVAFTEADVAAGQLTITDLKANSNYTLKLYNGEKLRGSYKFRTTEAFPEGYEIVYVTDASSISDLLEASTSENICLVFANGSKDSIMSESGSLASLTIPANVKNVCLWGANGDATPVLKLTGIKVEGAKGTLRFYNMSLANGGSDYVFNIDGSNNIDAIEISKCTITKTRGVVRFQSSYSGTCGSVLINNCKISNVGSYGLVSAKGISGRVNSITVTNSTVNGVSGGALMSVQQDDMAITVDQCTFFDCCLTAKPLFDTNKKETVPSVSNCLFGWSSEKGEGSKAASMKTINASDVYCTSEVTWNKNYEMGETLEVSAKDFFTDYTKGDFSLTISYENKYSKYGDPRWVKQ